MLGLLISACGASPTGPSSSLIARPAWVLTGQSNAREVRPALNVEAAAAGVLVTGWAEGGDGIGSWGPTTSGWLGWIQPALEQPGVAAFLWLQGEYEATSPPAVALYPAQLLELFTRVRATVGNPRLRVVVVEVSIREEYAGMRAAQKAYVASDADARLVNTEDLPDNGGHFYPEGYVQIARRIAAAVH